ncbi:tetratricopeptide repeat protein [cf. Phormidesmis sp. LEGE 11477]|uniref:tetratricopeptide repeat protein n=1 Tax=cf. Phormidesmis sp. LEGE 11477 TaxID=1828680 RepID=UPI001881597A|nr:tetratricopeptide repeat protein [cf. Phormidesmis sp. LEGE 11477]MBE9062642.1 tetratricopeptide repeat protein [cf. Phormidesmis sp. LEGE 11477]
MKYPYAFRSKSNYRSKLRSLPSTVHRTADQTNCDQKLAQSTHWNNPDSWLSFADTNLLLRKQARNEASLSRHAAAIKILDRLIVREPANPNHFVNRGLMHSHLQRYDEALADYNRAVDLNPKLDKAYNNRANLHAIAHNWPNAIADYDQAIDLNPLNIRARLNQAITFREIGDYEEALACLDIALFFRPQSAFLYAEKGRTHHLRGHWNQAIADYTTACRLAADSSLEDIGNPAKVIRKVRSWTNSLNAI